MKLTRQTHKRSLSLMLCGALMLSLIGMSTTDRAVPEDPFILCVRVTKEKR